MHCMFARFLATTRRKIAEETVPGIRNALLKREGDQARELEALGGCRCGQSVHEEFKPRIRLD